MKFVLVAMLLTVFPAALAQRPQSVPRVGDFKREELARRACVPDGCDCIGIAPGLFCGDGVLGCKIGDVYQCSTDGHTTCNFGPRTSCQKCGQLTC